MHGTHDCVNFICDAPEIRAVSFVGSNPAGEHVFDRGTKAGKRVQANLGAKNHMTIMPDADREAALNALVGAAFGAAGQRCMAISVAVFVGDSKAWVAELVEKAAALKVDAGHEDGAEVGPMISPQALARAEGLVAAGIAAGAGCPLDGRGVVVPGYEAGNFLGPTVLTGVDATNPAYVQAAFFGSPWLQHFHYLYLLTHSSSSTCCFVSTPTPSACLLLFATTHRQVHGRGVRAGAVLRGGGHP